MRSSLLCDPSAGLMMSKAAAGRQLWSGHRALPCMATTTIYLVKSI